MATANPLDTSADAHVDFPAEFKDCKKCKSCVKQVLKEVDQTIRNAFLIHIDDHILKPAKPSQGEDKRDNQKEDKIRKIRELERLVSALQNTEGGVILIHLRGGRKRDRHLHRFDHFFRTSRLHVIDDSYEFTNAYKREWLSVSNIRSKTFIKLTVRKAEGVSTVDYNTNICEDRGEIAKLIQKLENDHLHEKVGIVGEQGNHSGKYPQEEAIAQKNNTEENIVIPHTLKGLSDSEQADCILENLKLTENVTSVREVRFEVNSSETTDLIGYRFSKPDDIVEAVKQKIDDQFSVIDSEGELQTDIHKLGLCKVDYKDPLLRVSLNHCGGIVFHDKKGPRAYIVSDGEVKRMGFQQWYQKIRECSPKSAVERK